MDIEGKWTEWLRKSSGRSRKVGVCPLCGGDVDSAQSAFGVFEQHLGQRHADALHEKGSARTEWVQTLWEELQTAGKDKPAAQSASGRLLTAANVAREDIEDFSRPASSGSLKRESSRGRSESPLKRSRAQAPVAEDDAADYDRGPAQTRGGRLWNPQHDDWPRSPQNGRSNASNSKLAGSQHTRGQRQSAIAQRNGAFALEDDSVAIIRQPETRAISDEQLVAEVKGIYAGLILVESKCIEVDNAQNGSHDKLQSLNHEQWQALIALHRTLLHEHHDFFLASQHPAANSKLKDLAARYAMPARMWRHGIHSFLELLRLRLPHSMEHMLTFIYLAYSMMCLLYETVPAFEDTWIECLGDLSRYRMAIEDDDLKDREVWTVVSRSWYSKASDRSPEQGRLYHHLAILARPNAFQQLCYYGKSLCVTIPFDSARDSILTLFEPAMVAKNAQEVRMTELELAYVRCLGIVFRQKMQDKLESYRTAFLDSLDLVIVKNGKMWLQPGYHMAIAAACFILGYGDEANPVCRELKRVRWEMEHQNVKETTDHAAVDMTDDTVAQKQFAQALGLVNATHKIVFRRFGDPSILGYLHCTLVFIHYLTCSNLAVRLVGRDLPWKLLSVLLNTLLPDDKLTLARTDRPDFPHPGPGKGPVRPLPDDFALRGLPWVDKYLPNDWFSELAVDEDERFMETPSILEERKVRVLYLARRIGAWSKGEWLSYDEGQRKFQTSKQYDVELA